MPTSRSGLGALTLPAILAAILAAAAGCTAAPPAETGSTAPAAATASPHATDSRAQAATPSAASTADAPTPTPAPAPTTAEPRTATETIVQALNDARAQAGAQALVTDPDLEAIASEQAELIADGAAGFSDQLATGVADAGYPSHAAQAVGALRVTTATQEWLTDPETREIFIDDAFSAVGVAEAGYEAGGSVYVAVLAYTAGDGSLPLGSEGAERILDLTNGERAAVGLAPLTLSEELNAAAQLQADHQAEILEMTHDGLGGLGARFDAAGYDYRLALENVAVGQRTLDQVAQGWVDSPDHYENMVNPEVTEMGFAVTVGVDGRAYYAQEFGVQHGDSAPAPAPEPSRSPSS
ncbi:CAP domain-containing protein [Serinibacter salmoneus]|uniref:Uncharacterized protein YkwD n=1 Tax=Serinibacter salmoneus TaxID=556530 RepID=A0A2A9CX25_9MICO|nr:CAP domain-containing protein [Serinibacter salmoneus]PFG18691.1 uncharacterized protein YkwD [Serinibacter salmoneus]